MTEQTPENTIFPFQCDYESACAILANGTFPNSPHARSFFEQAPFLVCCDGAAKKACEHGRTPNAVVGDLDSLSDDYKLKLQDRIVAFDEQETNDLSKAFRYCLTKNWKDFVIIGATGEREDHTLGNISLLADFCQLANSVKMITDSGVFCAAKKSTFFYVPVGVQASIFSFDPQQEITSTGLKYPLNRLRLSRWNVATLNEVQEEPFFLEFEPTSPVIVFFAY